MQPATADQGGGVGQVAPRDARGRAGDVAGVDGVADRDEPAVGGQHGPDHAQARRRGRRELLQRGDGVGHEPVLQQKVLGRVPHQPQLGADDHVAALVTALAQGREDRPGVAVEVADGEVELGEPDPDRRHATSLTGYPSVPLGAFTRS